MKVRMKLLKWLNHADVDITPPLDANRQNTYDRSFEYKESQRNLIFTILLTAALVMFASKCALIVRIGAGLGIALILNAAGGIWAQKIIDEAAGPCCRGQEAGLSARAVST
jgi:hypothetical protein